MARTPKKSGGRKSEDANDVVDKRSSGRVRKGTELFNTPVEEKRKYKSKTTPKKTATPKKVASGRKSGGSSKKAAKQKRAKKSESPEEEEDYEVEKIVDHRIYDGHYVEYAVKWVGYPDETTWMTEFDLRDAPEHLADYKFSVTKKRDKEGDEYAIEKILAHRDVGKKRYYLVHWKGFNHAVSHTEMEEKELGDAKDVLSAYKKSLNGKKTTKSAPKRKSAGSKSGKKAKKSKANGKASVKEKEASENDEEEEEDAADNNEIQLDSDNDVDEEEEQPKKRRRSD